MTTWACTVGLTHEPRPPEAVVDALGRLVDYSAAATTSRSGTTTTIQMTVETDDIQAAFNMASGLARDAVGGEVTSVEVMPEAEFLAQLDRPLLPEMVGYSEIAEMAGVTRQRAYQLARRSDFPPALIETRQGPLMRKSAVERWLDQRGAHPGRRPRVTA